MTQTQLQLAPELHSLQKYKVNFQFNSLSVTLLSYLLIVFSVESCAPEME